jgi:hypothetical protein
MYVHTEVVQYFVDSDVQMHMHFMVSKSWYLPLNSGVRRLNCHEKLAVQIPTLWRYLNMQLDEVCTLGTYIGTYTTIIHI